tara:strand:- start:315 stop:446 length:132 start_codon:yes stop_codon:yes gene_type:complete
MNSEPTAATATNNNSPKEENNKKTDKSEKAIKLEVISAKDLQG